MSVYSLIGEQQLHFTQRLHTISGTQCISCIHTDHNLSRALKTQAHHGYNHNFTSHCQRAPSALAYIYIRDLSGRPGRSRRSVPYRLEAWE